MGDIKRAGTLVPGGKQFPIVRSDDVQGGLHSVGNYADLLRLENTNRVLEGMLVKVLDLDLFYEYKRSDEGYIWKVCLFGTLDDQGINSTLLSIISSLQNEVAKLRNSFKYGISSYNGVDTVESVILGGYQETDDREPLWAIDEDDLEAVAGLEVALDATNTLVPVSGTIDTSKRGCLGILDAYWQDDSEIYATMQASKLIVYMTTSKDDIKVELTTLSDPVETTTVSLKNLTYPNIVDLFHYLFILSRTYREKGNAYVYVSIQNNATGEILKEGYYDFSNITLTDNKLLLSRNYTINKIFFKNLDLTKLNFYTKFLDFSNEVIPSLDYLSVEIIPSAPNEEDYKYAAAAITIRSVADKAVLDSILGHLRKNELIWEEKNHKLYINTIAGLYAVGAGDINPEDPDNPDNPDNPEDPNTNIDMNTVILTLSEIGIVSVLNQGLVLNPVSSITFKNGAEEYLINVDSEGKLLSIKTDATSMPVPNDAYTYKMKSGTRTYKEDYNRGFAAKVLAASHDMNKAASDFWLLNTDRIKVGAFYTPLASDTTFGCSHAYVELENTSDTDFYLNGCSLAFKKPVQENGTTVEKTYVLPLRGVLPANSTFLIRGKQYTSYEEAIIKVPTYDMEWLELDTTYDNSLAGDYGFLLYYAKDGANPADLVYVTLNNNAGDLNAENLYGKNTDTNPFSYKYYYIDSIGLKATTKEWFNKVPFSTITGNSIYKNTFELDPAKQAFLGLTVSDSSRVRNLSTNDGLTVSLDKTAISFTKSFDSYDVEKYSPKASFEHKNVSTDKTKLDLNKPNMVTCAFGIDMLTTKCFNWISAGDYNEYVFVKVNDKWERFESYGGNNFDRSGTFTKKDVGLAITAPIYDRMKGIFPADGTRYTAHKCIISLPSAVATKTTYIYVVGRAGADGNPDPLHTSEEFTFTMYPASYTPRIYQITDQQGFHWIEYQVWAAAALEVQKKIELDCASANIIPVLVNTGDMTLNGSRINEWLDYYNAGKCLFKHLEQMNCVGNNDLCNINHNNLGTGDDPGKSNPYYFHLCYCYEQPDPEKFIVNGVYVPSTYYFGNAQHKFMIVNSELTYDACASLYGTGSFKADGTNDKCINIYTGYEVPYDRNASLNYVEDKTWIPLYETLYSWLNADRTSSWIVAMHEMPFTVITLANLGTGTKGRYRADNNGSSLVGSHTNQLNIYDLKGSYWMSRLLEYFGIDLCIGGHKHTYMCTFPLRENFTWDNGAKNSATEQYVMPASLKDDNVSFMSGENNTSKLPFIKTEGTVPSGVGEIYPGLKYTGDLNTVTYFMCQATGYKVKSNKELPAYTLIFAKAVAGNNKNPLDKTAKEKALVSQLYPMFGIVYPENHKVQLVRIKNILTISSGNAEVFNLQTPSPKAANTLEFFNGADITSIKVLDNTYEDHSGFKGDNPYWTTNNTNYIC